MNPYVAGLILRGVWWKTRADDRGVPLLMVGGLVQISAGANP